VSHRNCRSIIKRLQSMILD